jgi:hypothetical protein
MSQISYEDKRRGAGILMTISSWFSKNNLVIDTDTTKAMFFKLNISCCMSEPVITFKNMKIMYTSQFSFLGVNITNNLKWSAHIQTLCLKLNKVCCIIKSLKDVSLRSGMYILPNFSP